MEPELTPSESLKIIETMIGQAKSNFSRMSFYFLMWGALLIAVFLFSFLARGNYHLADVENLVCGSAMGLGALASFIYGRRESKRNPVINPVSRAINWLWMAYSITLVCGLIGLPLGDRGLGLNILLLTGLPTFVTGILLRFKPLTIGGVIFWITGIATYATENMTVIVCIVIGAMFFGYLVPGYLLKRQEDGLRTA